MYNRDDIKSFIHPDKEDSVTRINGFEQLIKDTATWLREFDPEFVEMATIYVDEDFPLVVDWFSCVYGEPGADVLLDKLAAHLNGKVDS
jgi:hypothetical protein